MSAALRYLVTQDQQSEERSSNAGRVVDRFGSSAQGMTGVAMAARTTRARVKRVSAIKAKANGISKAKAIAPDLAARIGSVPKTKYRGDPAIFGRLIEDHDRHRALFAMIGETEGDSLERQALFVELTKELKAHAAAEEQALWSTVMRDPKTTDVARHAVAEHKELDDMLADLAARNMRSSGWLRRFGALKEEYLHHIQEEEKEQFAAAEKRLATADIRYMRHVYERRKEAEKADAKVEKKIKLKD
jgi:hypothetical protein